jgi:hypothetical protein
MGAGRSLHRRSSGLTSIQKEEVRSSSLDTSAEQHTIHRLKFSAASDSESAQVILHNVQGVSNHQLADGTISVD